MGTDPLISLHPSPGDRSLRVAVHGELDIATADRLPDEVRAAVHGDVERVVVDLSGLPFLDSAGVQALVQLRRELAELGKRLFLVPAPAQAQRVLEITGTARLFDWVEA